MRPPGDGHPTGSLLPASRGGVFDPGPDALAVFEPGLSGRRRFLARLGTSRTVSVGVGTRPVPFKGLVSVSVGAVAGMMLAQPFDPVTFLAPLYGLVIGTAAGAGGWVALGRQRPTIIVVDDWRPQLDAISRILRNADRIGQPFASPTALRVVLHSALWHTVQAMDQPGDFDVLFAFNEQLAALGQATEATLTEIESPSIAARRAAVSERLAAAVSELEMTLPATSAVMTGDESR